MTSKPAKITAVPVKNTAEDWASLKDLILQLLPPMATLAGVSLAGVSLFQLIDKLNASRTIVDEVLAFSAVVLLSCYPVTIWAVRTKNAGRGWFLGRTVLGMFLLAVVLLVYAVCHILLGLDTAK